MLRSFTTTIAIASFIVGCGGAAPEAESPEQGREDAELANPEGPRQGHGVETEVSMPETEEVEEEEEEEEEEEKPPPPEPEFTEGMSVADARNAIPQGTERLNIDQETLGKPLQNPDLFKPCKLGAQKLKIRIAVWDGRAVGVDVITKNKKLAECVDKQIRAIEWKDKVKSLNTVEYAY